MSGDPTGHASASRIPEPASRVEANMGTTPTYPPTGDADRISATNSKVESTMNHRRRRALLRDANFSEEVFNAFNLGDAYIRAAQGGVARATCQYLKDIQVRKNLIIMYISSP